MGYWFRGRQSRRHVLRQLGMLVGAGLALDTGIFALNNVMAASTNPIRPYTN